jgi:hypothetical protein
MYKNDIVVLVKVGGQPLRETAGKFVHLPFNSEYTIELKNDSWRRAIVSVKIDGTSVLGVGELVIPAHTTIPLERFVTGENLSGGKRFKFVPLTDSKVQDPSSSENGLAEIEVWFEKVPSCVTTTTWIPFSGTQTPWIHDTTTTSCNTTPQFASGELYSKRRMVANNNASCNFQQVHFLPDSTGATVEGSHSSQVFTKTTFGEKEYPSTVFKFWLRGVAEAVVSTDKLYCTQCGKKTRFDYKYCPRCGTPVQIA